MSYEPEILISKNKEVLREILNPFTHAVAWDASDDPEMNALAKLPREFTLAISKGVEWEYFDMKTFDFETYQNSMSIKAPLERYAKRKAGEVMPILQEMGVDITRTKGMSGLTQSPSTNAGSAGPPHTDQGKLALFVSFNKTMNGTYCVPRKYAGKEGKFWQYHPNANTNRAIPLPGLSVYIINLDRQVHFAPPKVPPDIFRLNYVQNFDIGP